MQNAIRRFIAAALTAALLPAYGCSEKQESNPSPAFVSTATDTSVTPSSTTAAETTPPAKSLINELGTTVESRISVPDGFRREQAPEGSLLEYMRKLELMENGSPVMLYNGSPKNASDSFAAVFAFDIGDTDLQQCADSIIRVYAEYYYSLGEYDKIRFHLTSGFLMDYETWRQGNRISVSGNTVSWIKKADYDNSYECFRSYLKGVMNYAGTLSLSAESTVIDKSEFRAGDMLLTGGSPGHCVLAVDEAVNDAGEKYFLLAQGFMPAQSFHILTNPNNTDKNMWYSTNDLEYPINTPNCIFKEDTLKRWSNGF